MRTNLSDKQVKRLLRRIGGLDPAFRGVLTEPQIRKQSRSFVDSQLNPQRDEAMKALERRSFAGTGAISGYTKEHEAQLAKIPGMVDADFARQRADEQTSQAALSQFLQGQGQKASAELAAKFQAAGIEQPPPMPPAGGPDPITGQPPSPVPPGGPPPAPVPPGVDGKPELTAALDAAVKQLPPTTSDANPHAEAAQPIGPPERLPPATPGPGTERLSDRAAALGHGVAGESFAGGFAGLSRIGAEGAGQAAYAHELPGIAALGGRAAVRDLELQMNREASDRLGQFAAAAPGMAADQAERLRDRNLAKGDRRANALNAFLDRELQRQVGAAGLGLDYAKLNAQTDVASAAEAGRNSRAAAHEAAANNRAAMTQQGLTGRQQSRLKSQGRQYDDAQSRSRGHLVDKHGRPIKRSNGDWIPYKPPKSGATNPYG